MSERSRQNMLKANRTKNLQHRTLTLDDGIAVLLAAPKGKGVESISFRSAPGVLVTVPKARVDQHGLEKGDRLSVLYEIVDGKHLNAYVNALPRTGE